MKNYISKYWLAEIAALPAFVTLHGCSDVHPDGGTDRPLIVECRTAEPGTRTSDPDEDKIADLNIFIFDVDGNLEDSRYIGRNQLSVTPDGAEYTFRWISGKECQVFACANFGFRIAGVDSVDDLMELRYHLSYPDEYSRGIPMSGMSGIVPVPGDSGRVEVPMTRMMSKISISVDRTGLDRNVSFNVRSVRIGGCPKSAAVFRESKASGNTDVFDIGYMKTYSEVDGLNIDSSAGMSREVSVYMLENMQGELLPGAVTEREKVLDISDALSQVCSYIEMQAEYQSDSLYSVAGEYLTYRFYLGDGPSDFNVERNCHYHITVCPSGDGLGEDTWRIDKTGLSPYSKAVITVHPGNYIEGGVGEDIHVRADVTPEGTRFSIGMEELEHDREQGIYDYTLDDDGHGVTLHLKRRGSGILYFEAGAPVSAAEMVVVMVI